MIEVARKRKAVLALGGGGARGLAHLGVIEVVRRVPIEIEAYVGVSIGSLAGALCAIDSDTRRVQANVIDYLTSDAFQSKQASLFRAAPPAEEPAGSGMFAWYRQVMQYLGARRKLAALFRKPALLELDVMKDIIDALIPDIDIRDVGTPLTIVALDLYSGKRVELTAGPLRTAIMASAAIPGVFPPIPWDDMLLCDLGMMDALPTQKARARASDLTIAVEVSSEVEAATSCESAADIFLRLYNVGESLVRDYTRKLADIVICPKVAHLPWYDFSNPRELIHIGRTAAQRQLPRRQLAHVSSRPVHPSLAKERLELVEHECGDSCGCQAWAN